MDKATPETMTLLGDIYVNEGRPDLAASAYTRAIDLDPNQPPAKSFRALDALAARGANDEAQLVALKIRGTFGDRLSDDEKRKLLKLDARVASARGDAGESARVLEEIVALDPLDGDALILLGQHYAREGNPEKATVYFERAAGIEGFEGPAKVRLGQLLVAQGKYQEALPLLKRAQEIKPSEEIARYIDQIERVARARR
jgi:Flp pilus assembly protein TadD